MTKKKGPKPGTLEELSALIPGEQVIPIRVRRLDGPDAGKFEMVNVTVIEFDISQAARVLAVLSPLTGGVSASTTMLDLATTHPTEVTGAVAAAIGWLPARAAVIHSDDFMVLLLAILGINQGFFLRLLGLLGFAGPAMMPPASNGAGDELSPTSAGMAASSIPKSSPSASSSLQ